MYLHATHFNFLSYLRHDDHPLIVPHFVYHILLKKLKDPPKMFCTIIFTKLIIEKSPKEQLGISWDDLISNNVQNPIRQLAQPIEEEKEPQ